ncbi:MAG: capsular polysaccharide biosynthesis protein [Candidatus Brevundimonas colombiensis]|uniref:Capsular polysaccharide biosynthesis protein n=1 Tax=Candidatus Brevundimonas colombiensis TaxID=3121376 RepID=A0AAJ5WXZ4_9CAUL|nr:capsular polysaccharide biosynthesis protein [Brevundimonas sp.]WEK38618.1 MAG: capsular polysaccharide biosynthesis protein [Brevundimonas sp.]
MPRPTDTPSRNPAWVCAPGVLKVPFLDVFLADYDLRRLPGEDVQAVLGWGMKPTAAAGRRWAQKNGRPYVALEDGFLRSVGIGEAGATSLSLIVDDLGVYYDATRASRLEHLIQTADDWCDAAMTARARGLIDRIIVSGVSKTNMGEPLDHGLLKPGRRVLIVDQTFGDASIGYGLATARSFDEMIAAARRDEPDAQLIVKRHPAVAAGRKRGCVTDLDGVTLIDADVRPADLLAAVDAVYCVTSALGFEALLRGLPVRCFGAPFYSGWGLTTDAVQTGRRGVARSIEQVAAAALIAYSRYVDPVTGLRCEAEQALERLIALRDRADRLAGSWSAVGFAPAKRPPVRRLLNSPKATMRYFMSPSRAAAHAKATDGRLIWWAGKESEATRRAAASFGGPTVRMEDGFIRSRGLGSDFVGALSVALDDQGVYYDPSRPSRLETLIETSDLSPVQLARAAGLRTRVVDAGLSKYNLKGHAPTGWTPDRIGDRDILLVVGQVENDKSILLGCAPDLNTNSALVEAARRDHPDAFLVYRNHPDVLAGNRPGRLDAGAMASVDAVGDGLDIVDCLSACRRVATLTSLTGFEALMRGKAVSVYGRPFYAGWGLTDDRLGFERRSRRATVDHLVHAALIAYPLYVTPEGWPCEAEDLVARLIAARSQPTPRAPRGQVQRWAAGIIASLDRRPPPSY